MTEQNKELAEWLYGDQLYKFEYKQIPFVPDKDSNQLDLLWNKFIKEANVKEIRFWYDDEGEYWELRIFIKNSPYVFYVCFKEQNEARLNAILTYVKGLK